MKERTDKRATMAIATGKHDPSLGGQGDLFTKAVKRKRQESTKGVIAQN